MKKILLLSGYDASSHQYWRKLLEEELTEFNWTQLALPDRYFSWRARGSSLTFASQFTETLNQEYDLLVATSMVDLASLRGFVPKLASIPSIVYFHENQFVYPVSNHQPNLLNIQLTTIYSAFCADQLLFNSNYNLNTFMEGVKKFSKKIPDGIPSDLIDGLAEKSSVLPVPIKLEHSRKQNLLHKDNRIPSIVWNHRWEYDKQPEVFFKALEKLSAAGDRFHLSVLGQSFRKSPACFENSKTSLEKHIVNWGFLEPSLYKKCLIESDIVVSTAIHEFQGLSMLNAIYAGCTPVAPERLVYPEYIPKELRYEASDNPAIEVENLYKSLKNLLKKDSFPRISVEHYGTTNLIPKYRDLIESLINNQR